MCCILPLMEETIFQKIISGEVPADTVYETDRVLAFLDIKPVHKGHTLVIPKTAVQDIFTLGDEDAGYLMRAIVVVANAVKQVTAAQGINVIANNGSAAGQEVFHLHFHIIPRFARGEFHPLPHTAYASDDERVEFAQKIASVM